MGMASTKATADAVSRTIQIVKPHVPSIKFPQKSKPTVLKYEPSSVSTRSQSSSNTSSNSNSSPRPVIEYDELPSKYQRKLITAEEMEFIEKGGPV